MEHHIRFLFFILLLKKVDDHVDQHKRANPTLSRLVKGALSKISFKHEVKRPKLREHR